MGLVAAVYSAIGGLIAGCVLALIVAIIRKSLNSDSSFVLTLVGTAVRAVPVAAVGIFFLFFKFMSSYM